MTTTGERIAQMRKQRGLTQAKLANLAGISTSAVAMYETNRRQPDEQTLQLIATALGVQTLEFQNFEPITETVVKEQPAVHQTPESHSQAQPVNVTREPKVQTETPSASPTDSGWTNLALSREEARFILFMRMNRDVHEFLNEYMIADTAKRKQIEKAWRLIQAFQA